MSNNLFVIGRLQTGHKNAETDGVENFARKIYVAFLRNQIFLNESVIAVFKSGTGAK